MKKEFVSSLVCPEDHSRLELGDAALVERLNAGIGAGTVKNKAGQNIRAKLDGVLVRADGTLAYPIFDDIPMLLIDEAIPLSQLTPE